MMALVLLNFGANCHAARSKHHLTGGQNSAARTVRQLFKLSEVPMLVSGTGDLMKQVKLGGATGRLSAFGNLEKNSKFSARPALHGMLHFFQEVMACYDYFDPAAGPTFP